MSYLPARDGNHCSLQELKQKTTEMVLKLRTNIHTYIQNELQIIQKKQQKILLISLGLQSQSSVPSLLAIYFQQYSLVAMDENFESYPFETPKQMLKLFEIQFIIHQKQR